MKYLCLIYDAEKQMADLPQQEGRQMMTEYRTFTDDIIRTGHMVAGEALHPTSTATTIRMRNGRVTTTDGPFAETKEQLGGFYLIEAADLDEAMEIARQVPMLENGAVEIRPLLG